MELSAEVSVAAAETVATDDLAEETVGADDDVLEREDTKLAEGAALAEFVPVGLPDDERDFEGRLLKVTEAEEIPLAEIKEENVAAADDVEERVAVSEIL